jgi:hypothetical protein
MTLLQQAHEKLRARERQEEPIDPMAALSQWVVTEKQVQEMEETEIIWHCVASQHLAAWIGPANCGKTAIATFAAGELSQRDYTILYFQEDASAGDLPSMFEHAKQHGYTLLNSTLSGSSPQAQVDALYAMVTSGSNLSRYVLIFDTLKKYVDLMSKGGSRAFFALLRSLTQRGATVILLGHTNKHLGQDGKPIFEGVGDVRNDTDELIYLDSTEKDERGVKTVTLRPDKTRCAITAASFELDTTTMQVRALSTVVDVAGQLRAQHQREQDAEVIQAIDDILRASPSSVTRTELVDRASAICGHGTKSVRRVLDRYSSEDKGNGQALWLSTYMRMNNTRYITRNPARLPPLPNRQTSRPTERAERAEPPLERAYR